MPHFWGSHAAFPGPRPRTLEERVAAGLLSPDQAAAAESRIQYTPREWTFFERFATAGFAVVVSPSIRGPALIKHLTFTRFADNSGQPAEMVLYIGSESSGQQGSGVGSYVPAATDRVVWESSVVPFGLTFTRSKFLPGTAIGGGTLPPPIVLNYLVLDDQFFLKLEAESPNIGTLEAGGLVLVYENIRLEQLGMLL